MVSVCKALMRQLSVESTLTNCEIMINVRTYSSRHIRAGCILSDSKIIWSLYCLKLFDLSVSIRENTLTDNDVVISCQLVAQSSQTDSEIT